MSKVFIKRAVIVELACDCGNTFACFEPTQRVGLGNAEAEGWQVQIHRKGESAAICPECVAKEMRGKEQRRAAVAALRKARDEANRKFTAEMAKLKGQEKET